eukprot:gene495-417_t
MVKPISDSDGRPTFVLPLGFILLVTAFKVLYEDILRHRADTEENNRKSLVWENSTKSWTPTPWARIRNGDIVLLKKNVVNKIPADLALLSTSNQSAIMYVETRNLDGENNLKTKVCIPATFENFHAEDTDYSRLREITITYPAPSDALYGFEGTIQFGENGQVHHLCDAQFLHRGTSMQSTQWAVGVVVYTGHNTKIFRNSDTTNRHKISSLMRVYNKHVLLLFVLQFGFCFISACLHALVAIPNYTNGLTIEDRSPLLSSAIVFGSQVIQLTYYVPISLLISHEFCKLVQSFFVIWDNDMVFHDKGELDDRMHAQANCSNLVEELGCVTHVFSDKTGTLTDNVMKFVSLTLASGVPLTDPVLTHRVEKDMSRPSNGFRDSQSLVKSLAGHSQDELGEAQQGHSLESVSDEMEFGNVSANWDPQMIVREANGMTAEAQVELAESFLALVLCHSVILDNTCASAQTLPTTSVGSTSSGSEGGGSSSRSERLGFSSTDNESDLHTPGKEGQDSTSNSSVEDAFRHDGEDINEKHVDKITVLTGQVAKGPNSKETKSTGKDDLFLPNVSDQKPKRDPNVPVSHHPPASEIPLQSSVDGTSPGVTASADLWWFHGVQYEASSPDELALVSAARLMGFVFVGRPSMQHVEIRLTTRFAKRLWIHWLKCKHKGGSAATAMLKESFTSADSLHQDDSDHMQVTVRLLNTLEFTDRKRMSVICHFNTDPHNHYLFTKGADNSMLQVCSVQKTQDQFSGLTKTLSSFGRLGLRTLVIGSKRLPLKQYQHWSNKYDAARNLVSAKKRKRAVYTAIVELEKELTLLGSTAIEDKLQPGVVATLRDMQKMGIKVWMLTGDKIETAINIGQSCSLLKQNGGNVILDTKDGLWKEKIDLVHNAVIELKSETSFVPKAVSGFGFFNDKEASAPLDHPSHTKNIDPATSRMITEDVLQGGRVQSMAPGGSKKGAGRHSVLKKAQGSGGGERHSTVSSVTDSESVGKMASFPSVHQSSTGISSRLVSIIDKGKLSVPVSGDCLTAIFRDREYCEKFFDIALNRSNSCIACRLSPKQKADLVRYSRKCLKHSSTILAVGDGANDVGMILAAQVGVGIFGKEGSQAARSGDFAIGRFRFLHKLLSIHGYESLRRNTVMVNYTIYKNIAFATPGFFYGFMCRFSGTDLYHPVLKQFFNMGLRVQILRFRAYDFKMQVCGVYTVLPVMIFAVFDRHMPHEILLRCSSVLYRANASRVQKMSNARFDFVTWFSYGLWQALFALIVVYSSFQLDTNSTGLLVFCSIVVSTNLALLFLCNTIYWWLVLIAEFMWPEAWAGHLDYVFGGLDMLALAYGFVLTVCISMLPQLVVLVTGIMSPHLTRIVMERVLLLGDYDIDNWGILQNSCLAPTKISQGKPQ